MMKYTTPECTINGCDRPALARGWCRRHYSWWHEHGAVEHDQRPGRPLREDLSGEAWEPVAGYEGRYEVSNLGRVWSIPRYRSRGGLLKPATRDGYPVVHLRALGTGRVQAVHILVAEAFIGPCPPGREVRHLDGDKLNCVPANLAYGTRAENCDDLVRHGVHNNARKTRCCNGHEYTPENTRVIPSRPSARYCRTCEAARGKGSGPLVAGRVA